MSFYRNIALSLNCNIANQNRLSDEGLRGFFILSDSIFSESIFFQNSFRGIQFLFEPQ
jgi:hypothetical protein